MHIKDHAKKFREIINKYHLDEDDKAEEISHFLTTSAQGKVSGEEFAKLFSMTQKEAVIFLSFIEKGIEFKDNHLSK